MDGFVFVSGSVRVAPGTKVVKAKDFADFAASGRLLASAEAKAEALAARAEAAYQAEKARGYAEGLREGRAELSRIMMDTVSKAANYLEENESRIVMLVAVAMRKIMGEAAEGDRITTVVRNALAVVSRQDQITVRVPPDKSQAVQDHLQDILRPYPRIKTLDVVSDPALVGDKCVLETKVGKVEASLDDQLQAITQALSSLTQGRAGDLERNLRALERDLVRSLRSDA